MALRDNGGLGLTDNLGADSKTYLGVMRVYTSVEKFLLKITDVTDGTSNTLIIAECAGRPQLWTSRGQQATTMPVSGSAWADRDNEYITHGFSEDGTTSPGPCGINCTNENEIFAFHSQGANVLFADGSVHFLSKDMKIRILGRLITRAGGEVIAAGDY
jgi:prepilin-type processing-associated H-X9-DG protein